MANPLIKPPKLLEPVRRYCLSLPGATEEIVWGADLVFKVGGKMFAVTANDPKAPPGLSFKCSPEVFGDLIEKEGIKPAPYLAKHCWVHIDSPALLEEEVLKTRLKESYELVVAKLPRKLRPAGK